MKKKKPLIGVMMGSDSDMETMEETTKVLDEFKVSYELVITSAHRSPKRTMLYAKHAPGRGIKVLIAAAGHAAHLAGVVASNTILPVIGVPIDSSSLNGLDAVLSTVQMPGGVPVATMAIGKSGAKNAALMAIEILAIESAGLSRKLSAYRKKMEKGVTAKNRKLKNYVKNA